MDTDRNLLFGVLALQADLIDAGQFAEACTAWSARKATPLAELLVQRGWLTASDRADVDKLLNRKLQKHGGDARASLAGVTTNQVRQSLAAIADPEVQRTLDGATPLLNDPVVVRTQAYIPEVHGRYTLSRLHATGGIGRVWLARDAALGRDVALKELRPEHTARPAVWARFLKEAQITGQLEHPGIVPIYEVGQRPDGQPPYYTMRFVRGRTLAQAAASYHKRRARGEAGPLELRELLKALVGVCNAVAYAHSRGVLHRDLKPQNVVLGEFGEVNVLDWGLARLLDQPATDADTAPLAVATDGGAQETQQGEVLGTPAYMAPEQAEGRLDRLGPATDVYGLGAMLYEILTGGAPFMGARTTDVLHQVIHDAPAPPHTVVAQTPRGLQAVCQKALAKEPARRYDSPRALAEEIERWMADEPVSAWREPVLVRTGRWVRRHRTSVATALAALIVAVLGLVAVAAVQNESRQQLAATNRDLLSANVQLDQARDRAEKRVDLALGAIENFRSAVDDHLDVKNRPENQSLRKTLLQAPLAFYQKLRDDLQAGADSGPEARTKLADAYYKLATLNREIGSQKDALEAYNEAVTLLDPLVSEVPQAKRADLHEKLASALADRGALQMVSSGMANAALESLGRARQLHEDQLRDEPKNVDARVSLAKVLSNTAAIESRTGKVDTALATLHKGIEVMEEAQRLDPKHVTAGILLARLHRQVASILNSQKSRQAEALAAAQLALHIAEPLARANPKNQLAQLLLAEVYATLAGVLDSKGEATAALETYRKRLAVVESLVKAYPAVSQYQLNQVWAMRNIASVQGEIGQHTEALETLQKARAIAESLVRDNPTNFDFKSTLAETWNSMARPQYALGRLADTLASIEANAALLEQICQSNPGDLNELRNLAGAYYNMGILNRDLGRTQAALASYNQSLRARERLAQEHPDQPRFLFDVSSTLGNIAVIQYEDNQLSAARTSFARAVETLQRLVRSYPENAEYQNYLARAQQNLGQTLHRLGKTEQGLQSLQAAIALAERMAREQPKVVLYQEDLGTDYDNLGEMLRDTGKLTQAAAAYDKALAIRESLTRSNSASTRYQNWLASSLKGQAMVYQAWGQLDKAAKLYRRTLTLLEKVSEPSAADLYDQAGCRARLAAVSSQDRAESDKAMASLRKAVKAGYHDAEHMRKDADLETLRQRPDFQELLQELEKKSKSPGR
jgi:serine/threonine-protein kinase